MSTAAPLARKRTQGIKADPPCPGPSRVGAGESAIVTLISPVWRIRTATIHPARHLSTRSTWEDGDFRLPVAGMSVALMVLRRSPRLVARCR